MPIVLLVPACRGAYSGQQTNITFISIVKTIMAMSFIGQTKNNKHVTVEDQLAVLSVKEWDIGLQKNLLTFRVFRNFFKDDLTSPMDGSSKTEGDSKFTGGGTSKMLRTFNSSLNNNFNR
jgi:hypothetical protein